MDDETGKRNAAERQKDYRDRKKAEARATMDVRQLMAEGRAGRIELTESEEQKIRHHFGYAMSEKRTLAERDAVAARIRERNPIRETVTRYKTDGTPVEEPVGPGGLSLRAFPVQTPGDLAPTAEERRKLGHTAGER